MTPREKETISALSQVVGALSAVAVADSIFSKSVEKPINYYINKGVNNIKDNGALHEK